MSVSATTVDAQNICFSFDGVDQVDLFSYNAVTGAVTSAYFPATWLRYLTKSAGKLAKVLTSSQMQSRHALERLVAIGTLDGTPINTSAVISGDLTTLRLTASQLASIIVFIPHSMIGGYSAGQTLELPVSASSDVTIDDLGLSPWTGPIDVSVVANRLVAIEEGTGKLVLADNRYLAQGQCVGAYALDSNGNPSLRQAGIGSVAGTFGVGVDVYVGINGLATDVPPSNPSATYSQFIGVSSAPSKVDIILGDFVDI